MEKKLIRVGQENFKKLRNENSYFVDKSLLIRDLIDGTDVTLFTRPRRFGKTLNMNMIKTFFEDERDENGNKVDNSKYFEDLKIWEAGDKYLEHLGKYPVISLTLKDLKQKNFKIAIQELKRIVGVEYRNHKYILESNVLNNEEKELFRRFMVETADDSAYISCIYKLSDALNRYHKQKVIILIDEYDVPLENANYKGFYDEMVDFIRSLFSSALKTNDALERAIITGCLRISKESIFTGLNNLEVVSILAKKYGEYFGFTQEEVDELLDYYDIKVKREECKKWYDGYLFGETEVYNPWSIVNFVKDSESWKNKNFPKPYWDNTSSNSIIRDLIYRADAKVKGEIENLMNGGTIEVKIHEDITYGDIYENQDNLYNFLFFTGYLKNIALRQEEENIYATLTIPNREIKSAYNRKIYEWVDSALKNQIKENKLEDFYNDFLNEKADEVEDRINMELFETISYFDSKESYYHGVITGYLKGIPRYRIESNKESGNGRFDLVLIPPLRRTKMFIIECKISEREEDLDMDVNRALEQIDELKYADGFKAKGYEDICKVGMSFCKKSCRVKFGK